MYPETKAQQIKTHNSSGPRTGQCEAKHSAVIHSLWNKMVTNENSGGNANCMGS